VYIIGELRENVIEENTARYTGGGAAGAGIIANNTIVNNAIFGGTWGGAGLYVNSGEGLVATQVVANLVIGNRSTFLSDRGYAIDCHGGGPVRYSCNDLWNNGVDEILNRACYEDTSGMHTLSVDPLFCAGPSNAFFGPYSLAANSPVTLPQSTVCGHLGALPAECNVIAVESISWGRLKTLYRD